MPLELDEQSLRRDGFRPDVEVTLADGQQWWLPRPRVKMVRETIPGGGRRVVSRVTLAEDYNGLLEAFEDALESGDGVTLAMFDLAEGLLAFNYRLEPGQVDGLLEYEPGDPASVALWRTILDTARGMAKKPEGSTDDPD